MEETDMSELAFLELVETESGEVVLRRSGDSSEAEPLLRMQFSAEARLLLGSRLSDIARAMVGAGVQLASYHMANPDAGDDEPRVLH